MRWLLRWCGLGVVGLEACRGFGAGREEVKCRVRHLRLVLHLACCTLMSTLETPFTCHALVAVFAHWARESDRTSVPVSHSRRRAGSETAFLCLKEGHRPRRPSGITGVRSRCDHCPQLTCKQWNAMTTEVKEG